MVRSFGQHEVCDDVSRICFETVQGWLAQSYWSPEITIERVRKAAGGSALVIGAYKSLEQVGYTRVVSDRTTFAWLCDVIVAQEHQGKGIGTSMVKFAIEHPDFFGIRRWVLATRDAHGVYSKLGFRQLGEPGRWMIMRGLGAPHDLVGPG